MQAERLRLDMTFQIQQFYKWIINNSLTATEISLWHTLLYIANDAGYPIWLSIPLTRLEKLTGMKKDAIYKARESLKAKGRIEIQLGKGNQGAKYRIIPFAEDGANEEIEERLAIEDTVEDSSNEIIEQPPVDHVEKIENPLMIFRKTQTIIPMPPSMDIHHIKEYLDKGMEDKLLCEAVDITLRAKVVKEKPPMDKWEYFKGIIRNWYNNGIRTYKEYEEHERERKERMNSGGNKQSDRAVRPEPEQKESGIREFRIPGQ